MRTPDASRGRGGIGAALVSVLVVLLGVIGCGFQLPSPNYLSQPLVVAVRAEVLEFGVFPDRSASAEASLPAIVEVMPGDSVELEPVILDVDGLPFDPEGLDSIWFQCGFLSRCVSGSELAVDLDVPCDTLEDYDGGERCRLGEGDGRFRFEVPEIDAGYRGDTEYMGLYGVIAWDGQSAQTCWERRVALDEAIEGCAFVEYELHYGPTWLLQIYADALGFDEVVHLEEIPGPALAQEPNRRPALSALSVRVDGEVWDFDAEQLAAASVGPVPAQPGSSIEIELSFDANLLAQQLIFVAQSVLIEAGEEEEEDVWAYVFEADVESVFAQIYTSVDLHITEVTYLIGSSFEVFIDEGAGPGISRAAIVIFDSRGGEEVLWVEFEV
ncbi:hypothetical protein G6O69_30235 [Pseudenhygromyxa sp. WMMC2535]|uniref:hypothetical protein n=1 Tax=Pseudenhygromyxa sp. WMMC2535 TaxID=2712867 RepID=UPI001595CC56|nr:hypothetical protein [Pseudenhygromyxa sp. WMMC2535]NVB42140.1 hypothetical protein [Pseudenhygromyxa sp. WMMC2535]